MISGELPRKDVPRLASARCGRRPAVRTAPGAEATAGRRPQRADASRGTALGGALGIVACCAMLAVLLVSQIAGAAGLGFGEEPFIVSVNVPAEVPAGGTFDLTVNLSLDEGVHLYKNTIAFTWERIKGATHTQTIKPEGKPFPDLNSLVEGAMTEAYEGSVDIVARFKVTGNPGDMVLVKGKMSYQGCTGTMCFRPMDSPIGRELLTVEGVDVAPTTSAAPTTAAPATSAPAAGGLGLGGFLWRVLLAFLAGLGVSLTPCVYPMIPITIAIIGGRKEQSKLRGVGLTAIYVLGIAVTYAIVGLLVATIGGRVQSVLQSPWLRFPIAGLFVLLALSMFDVIAIQMPGAGSGVLDKVASRFTGPLGIFLLGIASGIVVGPCVTAPLLGVLTYIADTGNKLLGFWMLFALAWGMGVTLMAAGVSVSLLPKAGGWMNWVKSLMGFILLWAGAYFVSPFIPEGLYYLITALVLLGGAVFLGGLDTLTPDSGAIARVKRLLGLVAVLSGAALFFVGAADLMDLKLAPASGVAAEGEASPFTKANGPMIDAALKSGEPVVLDFTATWCGICKELDRKTFSDSRVAKALGRFRALSVDFDANPNVVKRYKVPGPPMIIVFDRDGTQRTDLSFAGFKGPDEFLQILEQAM